VQSLPHAWGGLNPSLSLLPPAPFTSTTSGLLISPHSFSFLPHSVLSFFTHFLLYSTMKCNPWPKVQGLITPLRTIPAGGEDETAHTGIPSFVIHKSSTKYLQRSSLSGHILHYDHISPMLTNVLSRLHI
jgi:hypothetical protein